jgi:hypothetical protein
VVVAVILVGVVEVSVDQVVDVVTVRDGLVAAVGSVLVACIVPFAHRRADVGVVVADFDHVLVDVVAVGVMEVPVMQVVDVSVVAHGGVAASGSMLMFVMGVGLMIFHASTLPVGRRAVKQMRLRRSLTTQRLTPDPDGLRSSHG